ncbi:hypothetical protein EOD39_6927 [Acipenser ruthenus]|uniref:Uncharacterized protein n=1 Tax=Acipenser ruthenus TaxID=7906 RepID=A0A444U8F8_ACIRT|nr:hypothetical protein EOD39_6927 [Acipenser ruthenus]
MATTLKNGTLPVSSLSAFSYIPPKRSDPKELTYFNSKTKEISRPVPVLSSSEYGRHLSNAVDKPGRKCVRVGLVRSEFYRRNGFGHSVEEGYGSVTPA